ncbi:MAG: hypothetical protein JW883_12570 [Deltaproteobacteria bacterium]|nr:hypothetical protein [Deltaproteobacteria bacterium]
MKIAIYVAFAALVLVASIFILKPKSEKPDTTETPKVTSHIADTDVSSPAPAAPGEKKPSTAIPAEKKSKRTQTIAKPSEPPDKAPRPFDFSDTEQDFVRAQRSPFDTSEAPTFPPLPSTMDDDFSSFADFPTKGIDDDDFGNDGLSSDMDFFRKDELEKPLDSGELR